MNVKRALWRQYLKLRFLLFQQYRLDRLVLEEVAGRPFLILPTVFNPTLFLTSEFMAESLNDKLIPPGSQVADMGTGSGIGAVFAAKWAGHVVALDSNPAAVRCARINVLLNEMEACIEVHQSDLFEAVPDRKFDVVVFNPPYFRGEPQSVLEQAFYSDDVLERFARGLDAHLPPDGRALLLLSSDAPVDSILRQFLEQGFDSQRRAERNLISETLYLFQLERDPSRRTLPPVASRERAA